MASACVAGGIAVGQIAAALEAVTTARVSHRMTVRIKGRDVPALGDGVIDFARGFERSRICLDGWKVGHLDVGADRFCVLPADVQQAAGKLRVR